MYKGWEKKAKWKNDVLSQPLLLLCFSRFPIALESTCLVIQSNIFYRAKHNVPIGYTPCALLTNPPTKILSIIPCIWQCDHLSMIATDEMQVPIGKYGKVQAYTCKKYGSYRAIWNHDHITLSLSLLFLLWSTIQYRKLSRTTYSWLFVLRDMQGNNSLFSSSNIFSQILLTTCSNMNNLLPQSFLFAYRMSS